MMIMSFKNSSEIESSVPLVGHSRVLDESADVAVSVESVESVVGNSRLPNFTLFCAIELLIKSSKDCLFISLTN